MNSNLKKSLIFYKGLKFDVIFLIIFCTLVSFIELSFPIFNASIVTDITDGKIEHAIKLALIYIVVYLGFRFIIYIYTKFLVQTTGKLIYNIRKIISKEILEMEVKTLDRLSSGTIIEKIKTDSEIIGNAFGSFQSDFIQSVAKIGILVLVCIINFIMGIYLIIGIFILYFIKYMELKNFRELEIENLCYIEKSNTIISELVRGIRDIKVLNMKNNYYKMMDKTFENQRLFNYKVRKNFNKYKLVYESFQNIFNIGIIILGGYLILKGLLSMENLILIYFYRGDIREFLDNINSIREAYNRYILSIDRVFELTYKENKKEKFGTMKIKKLIGRIEFKNVTFKYLNNNVINNMSFKIKPNQTVAFVGASGVGKSTIFNLISKMYNVDTQKIFLDNIDINELDEPSIRNNIAFVTQNPYIFNLTIKDNLKLIDENISTEQIIEVCKQACIHDYIETLPLKYDTLLGEGGINLSGGQKQRLAIARALIKNAEIILLDEATSALDNETQKELQVAINNLKNKHTMIIIAHRLSTVVNCDNIFVLNNGSIIAEGKHGELLESSEYYKRLYEIHFKNNKL